MAQVYKMMLGTSGRQWEQLTVREDGTMMLYFHGTDRSVTQRVTLVEDGAWKGWLKSEGGSLYPGIESGKWQAVDDGRGKMEDVRGKMDDVVETTENHAEAEECESPIADETITNQQQMNPQTEVTESPIADETITNQPRVRRQRKPRKPRVERQEPLTIDHSPLTIDHSPLTIDHSPLTVNRQTSSTLKAVGMVAAATVALFVIYETGLLIPLGLIGLATGGILK